MGAGRGGSVALGADEAAAGAAARGWGVVAAGMTGGGAGTPLAPGAGLARAKPGGSGGGTGGGTGTPETCGGAGTPDTGATGMRIVGGGGTVADGEAAAGVGALGDGAAAAASPSAWMIPTTVLIGTVWPT